MYICTYLCCRIQPSEDFRDALPGYWVWVKRMGSIIGMFTSSLILALSFAWGIMSPPELRPCIGPGLTEVKDRVTPGC